MPSWEEKPVYTDLRTQTRVPRPVYPDRVPREDPLTDRVITEEPVYWTWVALMTGQSATIQPAGQSNLQIEHISQFKAFISWLKELILTSKQILKNKTNRKTFVTKRDK